MDLLVARTAIQIGGGRLSCEDLYFFLFLIFLAAFGGLLGFTAYHGYHFRVKKGRLAKEMKEAEESIRRGFSLLRHDIEKELELVRKAKLRRDLAAEEKMREEKLLKDLEDVSSYIGKEVREAEEARKQL